MQTHTSLSFVQFRPRWCNSDPHPEYSLAQAPPLLAAGGPIITPLGGHWALGHHYFLIYIPIYIYIQYTYIYYTYICIYTYICTYIILYVQLYFIYLFIVGIRQNKNERDKKYVYNHVS
jgi:hypothetical protein